MTRLYSVTRDQLGRIAYALDASGDKSARAFVSFQQAVLREMHRAGLAAHLLAFDAIATESDLRAAIAACASAYRWRDGVHIEWERDAWTDRRQLSAMTILTLSRCSVEAPERELAKLIVFGRVAMPGWKGLSDERVLAYLLEHAKAWLILSLPGFVVPHVLADRRLQSLPRPVLVRESTKAALPSCDANLQALGEAQIIAFDGVLSTGHAVDERVIEAMRNAVREGQKNTREHHRARAQMLKALEPLAQSAAKSWISALLFVWAFDLIESGSHSAGLLAPATLLNYTQSILVPLAKSMSAYSGLPVDGNAWAEIYDQVLVSTSSGNQRNAASGLSHLHRFLMLFYDVEPLPRSVHAGLEEPIPAANVIWPHEMHALCEWLAEGEGDERMRAMLTLAYRIAWATRIRTNELMTLRLRNCIDVQGEIEIAPLRSDGKTKSTSGRRLVKLDETATAALSQWIERMRSEGATSDNLIFGDPYQPDIVYRAGMFNYALTKLLQQVSGDPGVVFHSLSHRWINEQISKIDSTVAANLNPLDDIAATAGHFSPESLKSYVHQFEPWVRQCIDHELKQTLRLTSKAVSCYTGVADATLRKRHSREKKTPWDELARVASDAAFPDVATNFATEIPRPPAWLALRMSEDAKRAASVIQDLLKGVPANAVASRSSISSDAVQRIARNALEILWRIEAWRPSRRLLRLSAQDVCRALQEWGAGPESFDMRRRQQPRWQTITTRLPTTANDSGWCAWIEGYRSKSLILSSRDGPGFIKWLAECGVSPLQLAFVIHRNCSDSEIGMLTAGFKVAFGVAPKMYSSEKPTNGMQLIWASQPVGDELPAAASRSLDGLHAWMLAAGAAAGLLNNYPILESVNKNE